MKRIAIVVALIACEGGRSPSATFIEIGNEGTACMGPDAPISFAADEPITIRVDWDQICLSSSCTDDAMAVCEVTVVGQTVTITTRASWFDTSHTAQGCTDDCGLLSATCETPPLAAGDYTFELDGRSTRITVPSVVSVPSCIR